MQKLTRVPCPGCGEMNLAQDPICLRCGKPLQQRRAVDQNVSPLLPHSRDKEKRTLLLIRLLQLAAFPAALCLVAVLLKPPSVGMSDWLRQNSDLAIWLAALLVAFIVWLLKPLHWRDFEEKPSHYNDHNNSGWY